jgi:uncharacterized protein YjbI with pentapeptide repeats
MNLKPGIFLGSFLAFLAFAVAIWFGYKGVWNWTGFGEYIQVKSPASVGSGGTWEYHPAKTLWDWLQLLLIPFLLAIGGYLFNRNLKQRDERAAIENQRETALNSYFTTITELLLKPRTEPSPPPEPVAAIIITGKKPERPEPVKAPERPLEPLTASVIRGRTLSTLKILDGKRKGELFRFLIEARLIVEEKQEGKTLPPPPVIQLEHADLSGAELAGLRFAGVDFRKVDLRSADLTFANLKGAKVDETTKIDRKWYRVWSLLNGRLVGLNLRRVDLKHADLTGVDFGHLDLSGANLSGARLEQASFRDTKINPFTRIHKKWRLVWKVVNEKAKKIDLKGADLSDANLSIAPLFKTSLRKADLTRADLSRALLRESDLSGAHLDLANLSGANTSGANLEGAMCFATNFSNAEMSQVNLTKMWGPVAKFCASNLEEACLSRADLGYADFSSAILAKANLSDANLIEANFSAANLSDADLRRAKLRGTIISEATSLAQKWLQVRKLVNGDGVHGNFTGEDLADADLSGADLRGADLRGAKLTGSILRGTLIDEETKLDPKWLVVWKIVNERTPANLTDLKDLRGAYLADADLSEAKLVGMDLSEANLSGANLMGADLSGAQLGGANLSKAELYHANLVGAALSNADLSGASLVGTDLSRTDLSGAKNYRAPSPWTMFHSELSRMYVWRTGHLPRTRPQIAAMVVIASWTIFFHWLKTRLESINRPRR